MGNWEFTRFIISLWKLIFYLIFTPLVSHTSNSKAVGNGKWEIECVLPGYTMKCQKLEKPNHLGIYARQKLPLGSTQSPATQVTHVRRESAQF